jgi:hypothetical protein
LEIIRLLSLVLLFLPTYLRYVLGQGRLEV